MKKIETIIQTNPFITSNGTIIIDKTIPLNYAYIYFSGNHIGATITIWQSN